MQHLNIRLYQDRDLQSLIGILQQNIPKYFAEDELKDFKHYIDFEIDHYFVIENGGNIVGSGGINFDHEKKLAKIAWDFINPIYHSRGIGKQLLKYRINFIRENYSDYRIVVRTSQKAYKFYEKSDFKLIKTTKDYWAKGFDLYFMELK